MLRELCYRENDGITVTLFWADYADTPVVALTDTRTELQAIFPVPRDCALDAFNHPFVYERNAQNFNGYSVDLAQAVSV